MQLVVGVLVQSFRLVTVFTAFLYNSGGQSPHPQILGGQQPPAPSPPGFYMPVTDEMKVNIPYRAYENILPLNHR